MLVARLPDGELVNANNIIPKNSKHHFRCPACHCRVQFKKGIRIRPHFAHYPNKNCMVDWENESEEHLNLKGKLYHQLSKTEHVEIEKYLSDISQIADLMINEILILEVQCSSLPISRLKERTLAYRSSNFHVVWLLGQNLWLKDSLTALQKEFLSFSNLIGFHLWEIDDEKNEIRLKYMIHEHIDGKVVYLKTSVSLSENLMSFFRFPYQSQTKWQIKVKCQTNIALFIQKQLYFKNKKWIEKQETVYKRGENLITKPDHYFYPQTTLPQVDLSFRYDKKMIKHYYFYFLKYYQTVADQTQQILYPPFFYDIILKKK